MYLILAEWSTALPWTSVLFKLKRVHPFLPLYFPLLLLVVTMDSRHWWFSQDFLPFPAGASAPQVFWALLSGGLPFADGSYLLGGWQSYHFVHLPEWPLINLFGGQKPSHLSSRWKLWCDLWSSLPIHWPWLYFTWDHAPPWFFLLHSLSWIDFLWDFS